MYRTVSFPIIIRIMQHFITSSSDSIVAISFQCNGILEFLRSSVIVFPDVPVFFDFSSVVNLSFSLLCGEIFKILKVSTREVISHGISIFHDLTKCPMELFHSFFQIFVMLETRFINFSDVSNHL